MQKEQAKLLHEFAVKVRDLYPKAKIFAFGSHVKGTATAESDMDICVVLPDIKSDDRLAISDLAWEVGFAHDFHLSTIVISENNFMQGPLSVSPLLDSIRSEGVAV